MAAPTVNQLNQAKAWAEKALEQLATMDGDERIAWFATAPRGGQPFNHVRVNFVKAHLPELGKRFTDLRL